MKIIQLLLLFSNFVFYVEANATTRYVKNVSAGNGSGTSWTNASADLQSILNASGTGDEVWVAEGTYFPTDSMGEPNPADARTKTFNLKNGVKLYGGFSSTGSPVFTERKCGTYQTILSGDIGSVDDSTDNCYHVISMLYGDSNTLIDGFVIEKGNAKFSNLSSAGGAYNSKDCGGAVYLFATQNSVTFANCVFTHNSAFAGGAIVADQSNPTFFNCIFADNNSTWFGIMTGILGIDGKYDGACILSVNFSLPTFTNCTFCSNFSNGDKYAVLASDGSQFYIQNCIFYKNSSLGVPVDNLYFGSTFNSLLTGPIDTNITPVPEGNIINADPVFVNNIDFKGIDGKWMTADDGLSLQSTSPCINKGDSSYVLFGYNTDIIGANRVFGVNTDIGAYELQAMLSSSDPENHKVSLFIYPNPATNFINLQLKGYEGVLEKIELIDFLGRLIEVNPIPSISKHLFTIQTANLSRGAYLLSINAEYTNVVKLFFLE